MGSAAYVQFLLDLLFSSSKFLFDLRPGLKVGHSLGEELLLVGQFLFDLL